MLAIPATPRGVRAYINAPNARSRCAWANNLLPTTEGTLELLAAVSRML